VDTITLTILGGYPDFLNFLKELEKSARIINVSSINFQGTLKELEKKTGEPNFDFQVQAEVLSLSSQINRYFKKMDKEILEKISENKLKIIIGAGVFLVVMTIIYSWLASVGEGNILRPPMFFPFILISIFERPDPERFSDIR